MTHCSHSEFDSFSDLSLCSIELSIKLQTLEAPARVNHTFMGARSQIIIKVMGGGNYAKGEREGEREGRERKKRERERERERVRGGERE